MDEEIDENDQVGTETEGFQYSGEGVQQIMSQKIAKYTFSSPMAINHSSYEHILETIKY